MIVNICVYTQAAMCSNFATVVIVATDTEMENVGAAQEAAEVIFETIDMVCVKCGTLRDNN